MHPDGSEKPNVAVPVIVVGKARWLFTLGIFILLVGSGLLNLVLCAGLSTTLTPEENTFNEKFHSGDKSSKTKIARIVTDFTIMPPYTNRFLKTIEEIAKQDDIKGVLLVIDSPGGLVSDSHEIYHKLTQLAEKKPIIVCMKGIAASGGYYIAMGAGPEATIYAEPTTWTGSIGVIMPRYNATELGEKIGVKSEPLTTGPLKDTLNPLKDLSPEEVTVWNKILDESFQGFLDVIASGRKNLTAEQIRSVATGQVYTAKQALDLGLVDKIGYAEDAIVEFQELLGVESVKVVEVNTPKSLTDLLLGAQAASRPVDPLALLIESSTPRAMYLFGWPTMPKYSIGN